MNYPNIAVNVIQTLSYSMYNRLVITCICALLLVLLVWYCVYTVRVGLRDGKG